MTCLVTLYTRPIPSRSSSLSSSVHHEISLLSFFPMHQLSRFFTPHAGFHVFKRFLDTRENIKTILPAEDDESDYSSLSSCFRFFPLIRFSTMHYFSRHAINVILFCPGEKEMKNSYTAVSVHLMRTPLLQTLTNVSIVRLLPLNLLSE